MPVRKPIKSRLPLAGENHDLVSSKGRVRTGPFNQNDDLTNKLEAINRALQGWNDQEVLRLLRLHWREIARFVKERAKA